MGWEGEGRSSRDSGEDGEGGGGGRRAGEGRGTLAGEGRKGDSYLKLCDLRKEVEGSGGKRWRG